MRADQRTQAKRQQPGTLVRTKVATLTGCALDWAVAKCEGLDISLGDAWNAQVERDIITVYHGGVSFHLRKGGVWAPSSDGAQGGSIAERADISVLRCCDDDYECEPWAAIKGRLRRTRVEGSRDMAYQQFISNLVHGPTPLVASMRCHVVSQVGPEVDIPEVLLTGRPMPLPGCLA